MFYRKSFQFLVTLFAAAALLPGCGGSGVPTKRVDGTLTFKGSPPPKAGGVLFTPLEQSPGLPLHDARGSFDTTGKFTLKTYEDGDGIIPGKYVVKVTCWRETPTLATSDTANYVPPDFRPEIIVEVDADEPVKISIDVPELQGG